MAEGGVPGIACSCGGDPAGVGGVLVEFFVAEVLAREEAELPEVVGDVLADIGDGAVGADDHLGVFVGDVGSLFCFYSSGAAHDVTVFVLAGGLEIEDALLHHQRTSGVPEVQAEDLALAGQEVVLDAEALHGFEMAAEDCGGDEIGDGGGLVASGLEGVEGVEANLLAGGELRGVGGVPLRDARVEVPAVEVDALVRLHELGEEFASAIEGLAFEMDEADDDIGYLHAGVVDVVLDADLVAALVVVGAKEALEGVAEDGVTEVADMRGLVGVDAGVLDEAEAGAADLGVLVGRDAADGGGAIEADVEVARSGDLDAGYSLEFGERRGQLCCKLGRDGARGFAEALGQLEGNGEGKLAEGDAGRLLDGQLSKGDVVLREEDGLDAGQKRLLDCAIHASGSPLDEM